MSCQLREAFEPCDIIQPEHIPTPTADSISIIVEAMIKSNQISSSVEADEFNMPPLQIDASDNNESDDCDNEESDDCNNEEADASEVSFSIIQGGTQRGGQLLVDSHGYTYNKKSMRKNTAYTVWRCTVRARPQRAGCRAVVKQFGEAFIPTMGHSHEKTLNILPTKRSLRTLRI